jgi:hypothetical protein
LLAALQTAVNVRGWPADIAARALLAVAADPQTRSPMRVAEAGPWWDQEWRHPSGPSDVDAQRRATPRDAQDVLTARNAISVQQAEAELAETDGLRVHLQRTAREQLAAEGAPVTKITVLRRAHDLLMASRPSGSQAC